MRILIKSILLLFASPIIYGQGSEIKKRIDVGELKMTFPSIYFKHNSTEYAKMPYTVDSCLKHIATHIKDVTGKPIWRDSTETEQLTNERIKKIKSDLSKFTEEKLDIGSMESEQKLSRRTINLAVDPAQADYLLSLNSVFDIAKTRFRNEEHGGGHGLWLFGTCWKCIFKEPFVDPGYFTNKRKREKCRRDRRYEQKQKAANNK
jgi:hypothetical protein